MPRLKITCLLTLALALIAAPVARAQTPDLSQRLPADTFFYLYWRGEGSITSASSRNALVSLWNDPGFEPARQLIEQGLVNAAARNPRLARIPQGDIEALLADPFILGMRLTVAGASAGKGKGATPKSNARAFLVLNASGKPGRDLRSALSGPASGKAVNVRFTPSGLLLASDDPATLAVLVRQFSSSEPPAKDSISSLSAFTEARTELAGRPSLEFFFRVPDAYALSPQATPNFNTAAFLHALHLEQLHVFCGSVDLNSPEALVHIAILGDASPGGIFDLSGSNVSSFSTLAAAPAGASVSIYRFDLGAVLSLFSHALSVAMPPQQAARIRVFSALLSTGIVPALAGEYAGIWPHLPAGTGKPLLALSVHPQAADRLFTTSLKPFVKLVGQQGEIRYYRPNVRSPATKTPGTTGATPPPAAAQASSSLLALTPNLVIIGQNDSFVRQRARAVTAAAPSGLVNSARFRAARAELPAQLSGLSYFDFQTINWTNLIEQIASRVAANQKDPHASANAAALNNWAKSGGGAVLARHLHLLIAGSWKDAHGVHGQGHLQ